MSEFKYIMLQMKMGSMPEYQLPIIFPGQFVHADVERYMRICAQRTWPKAEIKCSSAGFINLDTLLVYGESETLKLKSHPNDDKIIATMPYLHGLGLKDPV